MTRALTYPTRLILLSSAFFVLFAGLAMAKDDQPGPQHITREAAIKIVTDAGYTNPHDVDFDDDTAAGEWEIEAFDASGKKFDIEIDATSGKIIKTQLDD